MSEFKGTPGPWVAGEYDEYLGYDMMTGGIKIEDAKSRTVLVLDGIDFGQRRTEDISREALEAMKDTARLIAAAPELLALAEAVAEWPIDKVGVAIKGRIREAKALVARIKGE